MVDTLVVPSHAQVIVPARAFLVRGFLSPTACAVLGPQIIDETFPRWVAQLSFAKGWPARLDKGHHMARFGDPGVTYIYKDKPKPMYEFTTGLNRVRTHLAKSLGWVANCVVVNSYQPTSGLYPHRDGKYIPQLGNTLSSPPSHSVSPAPSHSSQQILPPTNASRAWLRSTSGSQRVISSSCTVTVTPHITTAFQKNPTQVGPGSLSPSGTTFTPSPRGVQGPVREVR